MRMSKGEAIGIGLLVFYVLLIVTSIAAWVTHLIVCIDEEKWGFLIAGAIMFPVAVIHGIGIWFGAW
jgi:hypothetical protein